MKHLWMVGVLLLPLSGEEPEREGLPAVLRLRDGSRYVGTFEGAGPVVVRDGAGRTEIPWSDVWSIAWSGRGDPGVVLHKGGALRGEILRPEKVRLDTGFGTLEVPARELRSLRLTGAGRAFADAFDSPDMPAWIDGGQGRWKIADGRLHGVRTNPPSFLRFRDELTGRWTMDIDVEPVNERVTAAIRWHVGAASHPAILVQPHAVTTYTVNGQRWLPGQVWRVKRVKGACRIRLAVDGARAEIWANGTKLGEVTTAAESGSLELGAYSGDAAFDNFRIE